MNFDQNISEDTNSLDLESDEETIELKSTPLRNRTYPFTSQLSDPYSKPDTSLKQSPYLALTVAGPVLMKTYCWKRK